MKYYYGHDYKEAVTNKPIEIKDTTTLEQYKEVYSCVFPAEEEADLYLEEDSYDLSDDYGTLKISKDIFDDFDEGAVITIKFLDEEYEPVMDYLMTNEDDEWIYLDYFG